MANIRQLQSTYQGQPQSVYSPAIRVDNLAPGLNELSQSLLEGQKITAQYNQQKANAQGEKASWQMEDWLNRFLLNMDSPEKLRKAFESTPYKSLSAGINQDINLYDSSTAQTLYKQALDITGLDIEDEATRNNWKIAKLREWEAIEPKWQAEANKWVQTEARNTQLNNLNSLWKNGFGTTTKEFNDKLITMRNDGQFGMDPVTSMSAMNDMKLGYQKAEQTAAMENVLRQTLMPYAVKGSTDEELNVILSGIDLSLEGVDYLTKEEKDTITNKWLNHAKNYSALYEQKVKEGQTQWTDGEWQSIQDIKSGGNISTADRVAMAQAKVNELIGKYNQPLAPYSTDIPDMQVVDLGNADGDELNKMVNALNLFVKQNGDDTPVDTAAHDQALEIAWNTLGDPTLSPSSKDNIYTGLYREGLLTDSQYSTFRKDSSNQTSDVHNRGYADANKMALAAGWDRSVSTALTKQLNALFVDSYGLKASELTNAVSDLIGNFAQDNLDVMKLSDTWQDTGANFYAGWISNGRNPELNVTKDLGTMQNLIESGNMSGMAELEPEMFAQYATFMGDHFIEGVQKGAFDNLNLEGLKLNDIGEPKVLARLVDPYGNALIAVEDTDTGLTGRAAPEGFDPLVKRVRVFSPVSDKRIKDDGTVVYSTGRRTEIKFTELTDDDSYYISFTDENDNQVDPATADGIALANRVIMANTGKYTAFGQPILEAISIDPESIIRSQRGTNPFR